MNKKLWVIAILALATLLIPVYPAFGRVSLEEKSRNIDMIIEISGIKGQLEAIPALLGQQFQNAKDKKTIAVAAIAEEAFTTGNFLGEVQRALSENYNDKNAREVIRFYNSELGKKIAQCEVEASSQTFQEKLDGFDIENYDQSRRKLIEKLFEDSNIQNYYYVLYSSLFESAFQTLNAILPKENRISASQMKELKKKVKDQYFSEAYRQKLLAEFYLMYEGLVNEEVSKYSKFIRSKSGKWVNQCIETGMINGFKAGTEKMVNDIMDYVKNNPDEGGDEEEDEEEEPGEEN